MADLRCCRGGYVDGTPYGPERNQIDVLRYFFLLFRGVHPIYREKVLKKWLVPENPVDRAISSIPQSEWDSRYSSLKVVRIINEPSASAAALRLHTESGDEENKILVIDFGGGTFDVSLVEYFCSSNNLSSKSASCRRLLPV